jgi:hypothetical protein
MPERSILAAFAACAVRLVAFALCAGALFGGAVLATEAGGSAALFAYAVGLPLGGGLVGAVVVVLEDRRDARRAPPRMIALAPRGIARLTAPPATSPTPPDPIST